MFIIKKNLYTLNLVVLLSKQTKDLWTALEKNQLNSQSLSFCMFYEPFFQKLLLFSTTVWNFIICNCLCSVFHVPFVYWGFCMYIQIFKLKTLEKPWIFIDCTFHWRMHIWFWKKSVGFYRLFYECKYFRSIRK